jgi:hypothetical protein
VVPDRSLREEIYQVTHNWPYPVIAFLIGSLIGWGMSYVFPPTYQAEVVFSLAYDDVQTCRNPDDCKNWQLEQMDAFAMSETVLMPTLQELQSSDEYWREISIEDFSELLQVLWRNTGRWQFVVESNNPERSKLAVEIWSEEFFESVQKAREHASNLIDLNAHINALNQNQVRLNLRLIILNIVQDELNEFRNSTALMDENAPLDNLSRWDLYSLAARASGNDVAWRELIDSIPDEGAPLSAYLSWIDRLEISTEHELQELASQLDQLDQDITSTLAHIEIETERSHSLSQTIKFSRMLDGQALVTISRRSTTAAVLGGIVGLLVWGWIWIALPIWRSRK